MDTKKCNSCNLHLDISFFGRNPLKPKHNCKKCRKKAGRRSLLYHKYGISQSFYEQLMREQQYQCAICRVTLDQGRHTHIDHNHDTGKVRGILCGRCNTGLGSFKDNPNSLIRASMYVTEKKEWDQLAVQSTKYHYELSTDPEDLYRYEE